MHIKSKSFLLILMIIAVFFLSSCGENSEQMASREDATQAAQADSAPSAPAALADGERQTMYKILFHSLLAIDGYSLDNGIFPAQKGDLEAYGIKFTPEYDVQYKVTEKDGKVEDFSFAIFNPAKTYVLNFDSSCYKDASCLEAWRNGHLNQSLDDSQIKPVE